MFKRSNEELQKEIAERKRVEERLNHLNAVLRAIRNVNQLITRERDCDRLLQGACETLIETRGYHNAWIALLDESGGLVTTTEAGLGEDFLLLVEQLKRGGLSACGRMALSQSGVVVTKDPLSACADCPLSKNYGGRGAMTVRLEHGGKVYGLLSVSIPAHLTTDREEQVLFEEVAGDVAFALHSIELEEERKEAEEALRDSRRMLQTVLDSIPSTVFWKDRDSIYLGANRALLETAGLRSSEEIVGKSDYDLPWGKKQADSFREDDRRVMESGIPEYGIIETYLRADGTHAWAMTNKVPLRDTEGKVVGILGTSEDITERRRAEEALRESEESFRALADNANDGIMIAIGEGTHVYANRRMAEITGYSVSELLKTSLVNLVHPDDLQKVMERFRKRLEGKPAPRQYEFAIVQKDGESVPIEITAAKTVWHGQPADIVIFRDITERKRAEEEYRTILRTTMDGFWLANVQGRFLDVNDAYCRLIGYSRDELLTMGIQDVEALEKPEEVARRIQRIMETGSDRFETHHRCKDGRVVDVEVSVNYMKEERFFVFLRDITERKRAEEALKEYSERLEEMVEERTKELQNAQEQLVRRERLAVLGQLAGGVGHELRNPLGVISNAAYFLQLTLPDADETTKEYLEIISEEVRNSTKIVSDLLDFSRTRLPDREEVAVSELVAQVLEKRPPPEEVEVITDIAPNFPPVFVDSRQIGQVLANLVVNAYQAMPEGGNLAISAQAEEGQVSLSIADTGCGIPPENMAKLFEPLFTTRARGIGLGLAVSRSLVKANEGSIEVESEVGEGSTFTVRLPTRKVEV